MRLFSLELFIVLLCATCITFLPGVLYVIEIDEELQKDSVPKQWMWSLDDLRLAALEAACSLPLSNCEYRPYHRRILSYIIANALSCIMCTVLFYPAYVSGYVLPLPTITLYPLIRIGDWEIIR